VIVAPRLKERYRTEIAPSLREEYKLPNAMQVPKLEKIVVNMGVGDANADARNLEMAMTELAAITGQKPAIRKARKSISNFKLRRGQEIGCMVTLRGDRMYEFMDRLLNIALPRVRDFRGIPRNSFDNQFNYTLGLREQTIFPEINQDAVQRVRGMNITFVVKNAESKEQSLDLLKQFGVPFRQPAVAAAG
jgi:large subunit ribosomal protein L5